MRAFVVHDPNGNVISVTITGATNDIQGDVTPVAPVGHRLTEVDASALIESERAESKSESEAVARALSKLAAAHQPDQKKKAAN